MNETTQPLHITMYLQGLTTSKHQNYGEPQNSVKGTQVLLWRRSWAMSEEGSFLHGQGALALLHRYSSQSSQYNYLPSILPKHSTDVYVKQHDDYM
jgi:hypothetical protein